MKRIDLTGQKFGMLTAVKRIGMDASRKNTLWLCKCDCGGETQTTVTHLREGHTKSCGCLGREHFVSGGIATRFETTHGLSNTRLYKIWQGMKQRCYNPNEPKYYLWGGRGITVCEEWLQDFQAFYDWAMNNGYADNLTIDRIDNDKGYSPTNCRWATITEQNRNRRCCKRKVG